MAKSGAGGSIGPRSSSRSASTRRQLIEAATETLQELGFAGSSARAIADRAGMNQGLIFYHFGSVPELLLAALDHISEVRLEKYTEMVGRAEDPISLVSAARAIYLEDLDAGYVTVLVEMIAGSSSVPGLKDEVARRIQPWFEFAEGALDSSLTDSPLSAIVPTADAAHAVVALYLGLEMLSHLSGDREPVLRLFGHAEQMASLVSALSDQPPGQGA